MGTQFIKKVLPNWLYIVVCFSFFLCPLHETRSENFQDYFFTQYSLNEGLSQSQINKIFIDSRGVMWIATGGGGVCRFDGKEFLNYTEVDGLSGNIITDIEEDNNGMMYFTSTWGTVTMFNGKSFITLDIVNDFNPIVNCIAKDSKGGLWFGSSRGVLILKEMELHHVGLDTVLRLNAIQISVDNNDNLWLLSDDKRVFQYDVDLNKLIQVDTKGFRVKTIDVDFEGGVWIGTRSKGIRKIIDGDIINPFSHIKSPMNQTSISAITKSVNGRLWAVSDLTGLYEIYEDTIHNYTVNNGLMTNSFQEVLVDSRNNVWLGSKGEGLIRYANNPFSYYNKVAGLNQHDNNTICFDQNGDMWVGNNDDGIFVYNDNGVRKYNTSNFLPGDKIHSIVNGLNGDIWIGTNNGLVRYREGDFKTYSVKDGLPSNNILTITQDKRNRVFIGTTEGISVLEEGEFTNFGKEHGLTHEHVHAILEHSSGKIYIGTSMGLHEFNEGNITRVKAGLCNSYVGNILEDQNGLIWVGTDRCIAKLDSSGFTNYNIGSSFNTIDVMTIDKDGNILVGTNRGIDKIILNKDQGIAKTINYSKFEGFIGVECNFNGVAVDDAYNIYFATIEGIIKYDPSRDFVFTNPPKTYLTGVKIFLRKDELRQYSTSELNWFGVPDTIILPYNKNHLSFDFVGVDFALPSRISYSYQLEGFDDRWYNNMSASQAIYSNLNPGTYIFKVKACNKGGVCSDDSLSRCVVVINTPFWDTWWFYLLMGCSVIASVYYYVTSRTRNLQRYKDELEKEVQERTSEVRKQNEEKTIMLKEIHHRVKNNLQIINSLFRLRSGYTDNEEALDLFKDSQNHVMAMAKIHEKLYQAKDLSDIDIKSYIEELVSEITHTYKVGHRITLNSEVEKCSLAINDLIPIALIINEVISNSMKHAFNERSQGEISVKFYEREGIITLEISDNGIGIKDKNKLQNSDSFGIELIKTLTEQLEGELEANYEKGTAYQVKFKKSDPNEH